MSVTKQAGIVTETESAFASPAFLVRRNDSTPRMVVDYRRMNKVTKPLQYPIPNFDEFDLASGYLQMPLTDSAKEKTAFITETQTGQF